MAYNYYDNFSVGTSNHPRYQTNNSSNKFYQQGIITSIDRDYNQGFNSENVLMKNKKNMFIREEGRPVSMGRNVYYPGNDQPLMAMMVVDSSPSSPSSNSQEGGRGYPGIPNKQPKKNNISGKSRSHTSKADKSSGDEKSTTRSSKKHVNGTKSGPVALRKSADEEYLTTKKVSLCCIKIS